MRCSKFDACLKYRCFGRVFSEDRTAIL